jgi:TetR/AcrR family tetracycline transcriptional repressor
VPQPRRIERTGIVSATIDLLDERGLDGVSMYAIAARLGVKQPALYHHFASKADLFGAVAAEVLDRHHTDRVPGDEPWDQFALRNARSFRRALLSVRDGARLITSTNSRTPGGGNAARQVNLLESQGFDGPDAILALIAISRYVVGAVLEEQASQQRAAKIAPAHGADADAEHFAELARQAVELGPEHEFETGLIALIRGLDTLLRR